MMTEAPKTVYLIDDDASIRQAIRRLLRSAGYTVEIFEMAEAFLKSAFKQENALLLIDIHLPGINGLELQARLQHAGISMPVIFITAYDSMEKREEARKLGAVAYFRKPVDAQALFDAIEWAMSIPEK